RGPIRRGISARPIPHSVAKIHLRCYGEYTLERRLNALQKRIEMKITPCGWPVWGSTEMFRNSRPGTTGASKSARVIIPPRRFTSGNTPSITAVGPKIRCKRFVATRIGGGGGMAGVGTGAGAGLGAGG